MYFGLKMLKIQLQNVPARAQKLEKCTNIVFWKKIVNQHVNVIGIRGGDGHKFRPKNASKMSNFHIENVYICICLGGKKCRKFGKKINFFPKKPVLKMAFLHFYKPKIDFFWIGKYAFSSLFLLSGTENLCSL